MNMGKMEAVQKMIKTFEIKYTPVNDCFGIANTKMKGKT
jgi:hypothetical protein